MTFPLGYRPVYATIADWFVNKVTESGELIAVDALDCTKSYIFSSLLLRKEFKSRLFFRLFPRKSLVSIGRGKGLFTAYLSPL